MTDIHSSPRFRGITDVIDFKRFERETNRLLFLGVVVAIAFHAALASYFMFRITEVKVSRPLTSELVIRRPRMTKPFELKKQRMKRRVFTRRAVTRTIMPSTDIRMKASPFTPLGTIPVYDYRPELDIGDGGGDFEFVETPVVDLKTLRKPSNVISLKEELISVDDLDTGRYKAMVIQDPTDKQNIRGFIYIGTLWGTLLEPAYKRATIHLADAINQFTLIEAKVDEHLYIDSRKLFNVPFVYLSMSEKFELTEVESKNFGEYLRNGGFAVLDNGTPQKDFSPGEMSLRWMIIQSLGSDAKFLPIPNDHPLYHSFFDFDDGPPLGAELYEDSYVYLGRYYTGQNQKAVYFLEGVWLDERLVAIYSDKGYCRLWADDQENEPQLKMGVNMVIFALIQEGGIARQLMERFSSTP